MASAYIFGAYQMVLVVKNRPANAEDIKDKRDLGSVPGSGRSPGGGDGNPLQYSCLENPMDRGAWWATAHKSQRVGHDRATSLSLSLYVKKPSLAAPELGGKD